MATISDESVETLDIRREITVDAPIEITFEAVLAELGPENETPDGTSLAMKLEPWPGGRWYRDLGPRDGCESAGHLWGHVQVIKPPTLLELWGPMFMSYPAVSHVQYRLTAEGKGTRLAIWHRAIGTITKEHREGVGEGWGHGLTRIQQIAARLQRERA